MQYALIKFMRKKRNRKFTTKELQNHLNIENATRIRKAMYRLWKCGWVEREEFVNNDRHYAYKYWWNDAIN
jgi:predicted transcriptional regulator